MSPALPHTPKPLGRAAAKDMLEDCGGRTLLEPAS